MLHDVTCIRLRNAKFYFSEQMEPVDDVVERDMADFVWLAIFAAEVRALVDELSFVANAREDAFGHQLSAMSNTMIAVDL